MPSSQDHATVLFRCDRCGRVIVTTPVEVRVCARGPWPQCCGADMTLYVEAQRPEVDDTEVTVRPLPLPGANPASDTTVLPAPPTRKPAE